MCAVVTGKPSALTFSTTATASPFILIAKYSPGSIAHAAMKAMMANDHLRTIAP